MAECVNEDDVELSLGLGIGGGGARKRCDVVGKKHGDVLEKEDGSDRKKTKLEFRLESVNEGCGSISGSDCGSCPTQRKNPRCDARVAEAGVKEQRVCSGGSNSDNDEKGLGLMSSISPTSAVESNLNGINVSSQTAMAKPVVLPFLLPSKMPCVSTTGSGPGGTTVRGFLYRYTKDEVCIVCVCHGFSFSPAKFVEHAGGRDVENPLRHITVTPFPCIKP